MSAGQIPYWRLSNFYLFFFASVGVLVPYWALYLQSLEFTAAEIGELMAASLATKIIAPYIWGWLADYTGRRMQIVRMAALLTVLSFAGVFLVEGYWPLAVVICLFSFFWNASLPQFEAATLSLLGDQTHRYSSIRLWGSVGFILAVVGIGVLLDSLGTLVVPWALLILLAGLALSTWLVPVRRDGENEHHNGSIWKVMARSEVVIVFVVCFLLQASHGPYYTFYTIYLEQYDYSRSVIGWLWALGVLAEIGVFLVMHRLLPRFGAKALLLVSLGLTTLRWVLIAWFVESELVIWSAQLLHAASFGIYHAVAIYLIHRFFTGRHQGRGQALYSSLSFGAGGAIGALVSGYMWDGTGATATFMAGAAMSGVAFVLAWFGLRQEKL